MDAQAILETLTSRGAVLTIRGDVLNVTPRTVLDDELRASIKASKRELLALMQEPAQVLQPASTCREIVRPDYNASAAFDATHGPQVLEPPEAPPRPGASWNITHGLWQMPSTNERARFFLVTQATAGNWLRYLARRNPGGDLKQSLPWATPQQIENLTASLELLDRGEAMPAIIAKLSPSTCKEKSE